MPSSYFGELVFNREKMQRYLDPQVFEALTACIDGGQPLSRQIADKVAEGMKQWALEHGGTHITHWFQPLNESTAEKHDSMMEYDGKEGMIESFTGRSLIQGDTLCIPTVFISYTGEALDYKAPLIKALKAAADAFEDEYTKAQAYYEIAESLSALRDPIDKLEEIVDNDIWPLPKYRELLFIS